MLSIVRTLILVDTGGINVDVDAVVTVYTPIMDELNVAVFPIIVKFALVTSLNVISPNSGPVQGSNSLVFKPKSIFKLSTSPGYTVGLALFILNR